MNTQDPLLTTGSGAALTGDAAIMDQVSQALRSNATTARYPIDVAAQGATVTLTGTVGSQDAKRTAEQFARGVPGVIDVTNELVVGDDDAGDGGLFGFGRDAGGDAGGDTSAGGRGVRPVATSDGAHARPMAEGNA